MVLWRCRKFNCTEIALVWGLPGHAEAFQWRTLTQLKVKDLNQEPQSLDLFMGHKEQITLFKIIAFFNFTNLSDIFHLLLSSYM